MQQKLFWFYSAMDIIKKKKGIVCGNKKENIKIQYKNTISISK